MCPLPPSPPHRARRQVSKILPEPALNACSACLSIFPSGLFLRSVGETASRVPQIIIPLFLSTGDVIISEEAALTGWQARPRAHRLLHGQQSHRLPWLLQVFLELCSTRTSTHARLGRDCLVDRG